MNFNELRAQTIKIHENFFFVQQKCALSSSQPNRIFKLNSTIVIPRHLIWFNHIMLLDGEYSPNAIRINDKLQSG